MKDEAYKQVIEEVKAAGGSVPQEVEAAVAASINMSNSSPKLGGTPQIIPSKHETSNNSDKLKRSLDIRNDQIALNKFSSAFKKKIEDRISKVKSKSMSIKDKSAADSKKNDIANMSLLDELRNETFHQSGNKAL